MDIFHFFSQDIYSFFSTSSSLSAGFIFAFISVFLSVTFFIYILTAIGLWKMFKKAGKNGWEALIPIYNTYILCKITGVNPWWIVITFLAGFITSFSSALSILGSLVTIYFNILLAVGVARSFGKSDGYAVGIYFFDFIFYIILGFGSSNYLGPNPMKDIIFSDNNFNTNNNCQEYNTTTTFSKNSDSSFQYCSNCGASVDRYHRFCPHCGKEL